MIPGRIRPIAICIVRRDGDLFVFEGHDSVKGETFFRPLGGGIEFGERSEQAVRRELHEELSAELVRLRQVGVLENLFTHEGESWHEIVFVFEGDFANPDLYRPEFATTILDNGQRWRVLWKPLSEFDDQTAILYPEGLLELINRIG
jgi:8-oxo-dGTP pyrophosphatase MutT (NUDIX family)